MHLASYSAAKYQGTSSTSLLSQAKIPVGAETYLNIICIMLQGNIKKHLFQWNSSLSKIATAGKLRRLVSGATDIFSTEIRLRFSPSQQVTSKNTLTRSDSGLTSPSSTAAVTAYMRKSKDKTSIYDAFSAFSTSLSLQVFLTWMGFPYIPKHSVHLMTLLLPSHSLNWCNFKQWQHHVPSTHSRKNNVLCLEQGSYSFYLTLPKFFSYKQHHYLYSPLHPILHISLISAIDFFFFLVGGRSGGRRWQGSAPCPQHS